MAVVAYLSGLYRPMRQLLETLHQLNEVEEEGDHVVVLSALITVENSRNIKF